MSETNSELIDDDHIRLCNNAINAYALSELLQDAKFRNEVMDELVFMVEKTGCGVFLSIIIGACKRTTIGSKLIRYLVDMVATSSFDEGLDRKEYYRDLPFDFLVELTDVCHTERYLDIWTRLPRNRARCFYHYHKDESNKCI